ncbi:hypothetical protein C1H76_6211 [Elsinoe australis]|uniref:Uncharacterized protein n=1 Tax=Elsinoe australis TaxID=40998 RepID=A0A4U7AWW6_9PEZI|nr:hypothetical protein C1H76_6211 [Elsinoe australis]
MAEEGTPVQSWKQNKALVAYLQEGARNKRAIHPEGGRLNLVPAGIMMHNGGQGAGDGGCKIIFDTGWIRSAPEAQNESPGTGSCDKPSESFASPKIAAKEQSAMADKVDGSA